MTGRYAVEFDPRHPVTVFAEEPVQANPPALYDALNCASLAVLLAESGDPRQAETALLEASAAACEAFPAGSPEAEALGIVLAAAGRVPDGRPS